MDTLSRLFLKRQKVRIYFSSDSSFAVAAAVTCRCGGDSGEVPLVHPGRVLLSAGDMALRCPRCSLAPQPLMTLIWPASHASSHHALLDAVSAPHLFILLSVYWEQSSLCSSRYVNMWNIEFTLGKSQTCGIIQPRTTHDYGIEMWNYEIKVIIIRLKVKLIKEKSHTDGRDSLKHEINVIIIRLKVKIGKEKYIIMVNKVEMMR